MFRERTYGERPWRKPHRTEYGASQASFLLEVFFFPFTTIIIICVHGMNLCFSTSGLSIPVPRWKGFAVKSNETLSNKIRVRNAKPSWIWRTKVHVAEIMLFILFRNGISPNKEKERKPNPQYMHIRSTKVFPLAQSSAQPTNCDHSSTNTLFSRPWKGSSVTVCHTYFHASYPPTKA